jgi:serine/threonine protein phosphatase PrpC
MQRRAHVGHGLIRKGHEASSASSGLDEKISSDITTVGQLQKTDEKITTISHKCPFYGCVMVASEISQLNSTNATEFISPTNILLTHKSNRKVPAPVNQDRAILISPFVPSALENPQVRGALSSIDNFLTGIFDGHDNAGGDVAQFASTEIPLRIATKLRDIDIQRDGTISNNTIDYNAVKNAIIQAHEEVDVALPPEQSMMGGCTAHVVLRLGSTLYMSNVGDSYSYLVTYTPPVNGIQEVSAPEDLQPHLQGSITIHHENTRHKPHLPEENSRIKSLGGRIHIPPPPKNPMGSRVIVKSTTHNEDVGLAMSRSIGDLEWTKVGVIPTPDVEVIDLTKLLEEMDGSSQLFVVVASDGLFDNRKKEFVTKHLAYILYELVATADGRQPRAGIKLLEGAKTLVNAASPLKPDWYRDDISLVVKAIKL